MKLKMICDWEPWPIPAPLNVLYLIARQYLICWVLALILVLGAGGLVSIIFGAAHARPLISLFFPVGYAVLAEESARWIYSMGEDKKVRHAVMFMATIVIFEGTLRSYINAQYTQGHFNILQVVLFCTGQYVWLNLPHFLNSGFMILWMRVLKPHFAWVGFTLCCLFHYTWNTSASIQEFYLKWMNWMLAVLE